ncbi:MAG TPA: hypothetical protein VJL58_03360 [Pyrinomonadaceae bacterium]|nr:hypothetical protein [Pyrinomonadaceae bacterium]
MNLRGPEFPEYFSLERRYAVYRPAAEVSLSEAVDMIDAAIRCCRDNDVTAILVDVRRLTGFASPSVFDRFQFASQWAETAGGCVTLSVIAPAELIDRGKIGVTVGSNRGLKSNVFTSENDAIEWLESYC